jgi:hypothetical protein
MSEHLNLILDCRTPASIRCHEAVNLGHPDDVLNDAALTKTEKRSILAAWASDSRAVHDAPALRQLDNGAIVAIDDIMRALRALDDGDDDPPPAAAMRAPTAGAQSNGCTNLIPRPEIRAAA